MASTSCNTVMVMKMMVARVKRGKGDILRELPPPPLANNLHTPPLGKKIVRKKADILVSAEAVVGMMPLEGMVVVEVDKVAKGLEMKEDNVYDICNVMEGLGMMLRQSRNVYVWQGRTALMSALLMLKQKAEKEDMMGQLSMVKNFLGQDSIGELRRLNKVDKSSESKYNLVMMTQKLMMMFLILPQSRTLLLLEASIIIHGPVLTNAKRKSSMWRLEDIAKIMGSVGLVAKVMQKKGDSRKNISYHYTGQVPHLSILTTQCEDVEMVEDLIAVRDIVEDGMEDEAG
jgi:hypothetical protein